MDKQHRRATRWVAGVIGVGCLAANVYGQETEVTDLLETLKSVVQEKMAENEPGAAAEETEVADTANATASDAQPASLFEAGAAPEVASKQVVTVGSFGQIDLHVRDLQLTKVLQLLSIQSQRNIVASRNITGAISADLYGVDFYEALDAVLHSNGFGYQEKGKFIYVYTASELQVMQEAAQKMVVKVVRLNYLPAGDAAQFVKPLLSETGSISVNTMPAKGFQPTISDAGENSFAGEGTLVIRDFEEHVEQIDAVIAQLDVRPKQVLIEATILEAKLTEKNSFGVDMTILVNMDLVNFINPMSTIDQLVNGSVKGQGSAIEITPGETGSGDRSFRFGVVGSNAAVFVKALDSVTDTTVIANPKVMVLNRHRAELLVGERLGYISTIQTETSETQTVEFLDVGTQLTVRPFVGNDGFIRLELRPSISDGSTRLVGGFVIPNTTNEEMVTNILVRNGQTVVMGGLFKEDVDVGRRQVPLLGNVPLAGAAFRGQDDTVGRTEVIFLIKPTVVKDHVLFAEGERVRDSIDLARIGARQRLLPFSRTKLVASHMRKAVDYMEAGRHDKAMWWVNMVLTMEPMLVEAVRMKETLTGERVYGLSNSIMKQAAADVIDAELHVPAPPEETETP